MQCGPYLFLNVSCKEIFRCVVADAMNREKHLFEKKWIWQWTMKHQFSLLESAKKYFLSVFKCCTHHIDLDWREARHISSIYLPPIKWRIESCEHCSILLEFARNKLRNQSFLVSKDWTGFQLFCLEFWWNKVSILKIILQLTHLKRL